MAKNVQMPLDAFLRLVQYFYLENHEKSLYEEITKDIEHKLDSLAKHELYTQYKTADTEQEREQARKKYLDAVGMRESFRY